MLSFVQVSNYNSKAGWVFEKAGKMFSCNIENIIEKWLYYVIFSLGNGAKSNKEKLTLTTNVRNG